MKKMILTMALLMCSKFAMAFSYTLEISEDELQSKVSAMMPLEKKKYFVTVVLSNPNVDLSAGDNKIGVLSDIKISAPAGIKGAGTVKVMGSLSYDPKKAAFFFSNPEIVTFESQDIAPKHLPKAKSIAQLAVNKFLSVKPVYKLKDGDVKQELAKAVLQSVKVENNTLLVELRVF